MGTVHDNPHEDDDDDEDNNEYDGNDNDENYSDDNDDKECKRCLYPVVHFLTASRLHSHLDISRDNKKHNLRNEIYEESFQNLGLK